MRKIPVFVLFLMTLALPCHLRADAAYTAIVSNEAPLLYWNFDEGSGPAKQIMPLATPQITNNLSPVLTATRVDHASLGDGLKLGNAISFLAEGDSFSGRLNTVSPTLQPPYAIEFWIQVQGDTNTQRFDYVMGFGTGNYPAVLYDYNTPRLSFEMYSQDAGRSAVGPAILDGNWHHLVIAYYGDGTTGVGSRLSMYLDGTNAASDVRANFHRALDLSQLTAGSGSPLSQVGFIGNLDELAIYNLHNLTNEADITAKVAAISANHFALATSAASPDAYTQGVLADSPFLYWNFNETDGDALEIAPQTIPPANSLYPLNNAGYISHAATGSGLALGNAASFTAQTNGFAPVFSTAGTFGIPATLNAPYAIEYWVQIQGDTNGTPLTHRYDYALAFNGNFPAVIYDYNDPRFAWELFSTGGGGRSDLGAQFVDYSWHHIVFVYYGDGVFGVADRLSMYLDGTNAVPSMRGTFTRALQTASVVAGCYNTSGALVDTFFGNIDELAIYDLSNLPDEASVTTKAEAIASHYYAATRIPKITITSSNSNVITSWPTSLTGYALQSSPTVLGPWVAEGTAPNLVSNTFQVTFPITSTNRFFRLQN